jgi:hypothetical protein
MHIMEYATLKPNDCVVRIPPGHSIILSCPVELASADDTKHQVIENLLLGLDHRSSAGRFITEPCWWFWRCFLLLRTFDKVLHKLACFGPILILRGRLDCVIRLTNILKVAQEDDVLIEK